MKYKHSKIENWFYDKLDIKANYNMYVSCRLLEC